MIRARALTGLNGLQALCGLVLIAGVVCGAIEGNGRIVWATLCGFAFFYDGAWRLAHRIA